MKAKQEIIHSDIYKYDVLRTNKFEDWKVWNISHFLQLVDLRVQVFKWAQGSIFSYQARPHRR